MTMASGIEVGKTRNAKKRGVVLGEDWTNPGTVVEAELRERRQKRGLISINRSPLARKIITFNLLAILVLVAGVLYLNPFRDSLVVQREAALVTEAGLVAQVFAAKLDTPDPANAAAVLGDLQFSSSNEIFVYDQGGDLVASTVGMVRNAPENVPGLNPEGGNTMITNFLNTLWDGMSAIFAAGKTEIPPKDFESQARALVERTLAGSTQVNTGVDANGGAVFAVSSPIRQGGAVIGAVAITSAAGEIDRLVREEREQVLQMFVIAILVSIGLSLVLASTIANPLSDLAAAAEIGRDRNSKTVKPSRVRIPDLTARPDEIGRLSGALRGMVAALYDRIDANEQFAADVAHEIKNPLASLRSAVGSLRFVKKDEQRERLLDVIDHDVRRLDRLVSDISNASRLDSELVKEEEESFDLLNMLGNLTEYLGEDAKGKGVEFISDLPSDPIIIDGLESRLAQVFVNLISNAVSFCEDGDAIRVWARKRENRVLVVVEDTGPGIPDSALAKVFNRFYSERPEGQFGNNSGLGLAISKQIVEAHGGVIWAENIRPTDADITSDPLGARFVVGLPV
ncbi:sensor histidine kinase [Oceaniglobus ichthyenteri]|uniref:sensor histidine kinase n=1 Tax=Oceaniglobus ichthyenteri TaxID=2136177 RepID=UPI000D33A333|nr:sensor histidine kinase [Oceaniglobus ichthyenteri]